MLLLLCLWGTVSAQEAERELDARMVFAIRHANRENIEEQPYEPVGVVVRQPRAASPVLNTTCCKSCSEWSEFLRKPCPLYELSCRDFLTCGNRIPELDRAACAHLAICLTFWGFIIFV